VDNDPGQPANQRAVDADELKIATNGIFNAVGDCAGIPSANRI
jgi:hypothetical protein